ncbi:hypothetical protein, partial [Enterobacter hormaechei]|uniref:hypothetical protein n=1 Tax=Enterobacter hormaechei TaxID=158836 RepID=UPI00203DDC8E
MFALFLNAHFRPQTGVGQANAAARDRTVRVAFSAVQVLSFDRFGNCAFRKAIWSARMLRLD